MEQWRKYIERGEQVHTEMTLFTCHLVHYDPTWTGLGLTSGLSAELPTNNRLNQRKTYKESHDERVMSVTSVILTYLLTPWCRVLLEKLTDSAASQEISCISRNPKVHYRTHKRPPTFSILCQPNPVHIPTSHLLEIHPNIIHPSTPRSPQWSPSLRFPHHDPIHPLSSPIHATCPAHLIILDFITRTILGEEYRSFSSSLCNLLHSPVTSSLRGPIYTHIRSIYIYIYMYI